MERDWPKQVEFPFDSDRKRSSVVRRAAGGQARVFVNGAPGPLLARCKDLCTGTGIRPLTAQDRQEIWVKTSALATRALRVLGSAYRGLDAASSAAPTADKVERDLVSVDLTAMYDPPRLEAKASIAACHAAGIRVVMITSNHPETARAIAREIGFATSTELAVAGTELNAFSEDELRQRAPKSAGYARARRSTSCASWAR